MNLLLDTCTFLWIFSDPAKLSRAAREAFEDPENLPCLSAVSAWEIAVKHQAGRLRLADAPSRLIPAQRALHRIADLPLDEDAALAVAHLPELHRDPFDRMLVCQAIAGGLTIVTPDIQIQRYPVRTLW